jgi:hypothetical protein
MILFANEMTPLLNASESLSFASAAVPDRPFYFVLLASPGSLSSNLSILSAGLQINGLSRTA